MNNTGVEHVATTSEPVLPESVQKLRDIFPQFVQDGEIDFDALKAFFDAGHATAGPEKYGLSWAGKSDAFRAIRMPATGTLAPQAEESKEWDTTQNLFLEGDNLEVLKLLQRHYRNKIKMIYIDPPYNTGKDFVYKDNFTESVADYYERTGQAQGGIKLTANTEKNGRFHSDWLTMMYPRLFLAKNLLKEDGVIFVSIDDNEVANLRLIMDEIFGEENFVASIVWQKKYAASNDNKYISYTHEYILLYARHKEAWKPRMFERSEELNNKYSNPDNDPRGPWYSTNLSVKTFSKSNYYEIIGPTGTRFLPPPSRCWVVSKERFGELLNDNRVWFGKDGSSRPYQKTFLSEVQQGTVPTTLWLHEDAGHTVQAKTEIRTIFHDTIGLFDTPKPTKLISRLLTLSGVTKEDIILDFFAGSGTTAHAVMELNALDNTSRKWICVQLPEETEEGSEARKAGYKTIADISRERIRRASKFLAENIADVGGSDGYRFDGGFKSLRLQKSNYSVWHNLTETDDEAKLKEQSKMFVDHPLVAGYDEKSVVYEILLKEGFDLNAKVAESKIGDIKVWTVTADDRTMFITFAPSLTRTQLDALHLAPENTLVCLDSALDDSLKLNLSRNVNLKTI